MNAPDHRNTLVLAQAAYMVSNAGEPLICVSCFGDSSLHEIVKSSGTPGECVACGKTANGLPIGQIAMHLDKVIKKLWYGSFPNDEEHYPGANLRSIVREVLNEEHACEDAIIEALKSNERNGKAKGTFYTDTALYERRQVTDTNQR